MYPIPARKTPNILVVDDNSINLEILTAMLEDRGYKVTPVLSGLEAIQSAQANLPDLILLDISMPGMDGYTVCGTLKSDVRLKDIPVIFTSALTETGDKVKAFAVGGVDYVTKPFQIEEVQARVDTHLKMRGLQLELQTYNDNLEEIVLARTRDLARALKRLSILDNTRSDFLTLISHELRTPLNGILGIADLIFDEVSSESAQEYRVHFEKSRERLMGILEDASMLSEIKTEDTQFKWASVPLAPVLKEAMEKVNGYAASRNITFKVPAVQNHSVLGRSEFLVRSFYALLDATAKFSKSGETVVMDMVVEPTELKLTIEGVGKNIPDQVMAKFFEILAIGQHITVDHDLGLGPPVAQRLLTLMGGTVKVENTPAPGIRFTARLKRTLG